MMTRPSSYNIEQFKNCILVTLRGNWTMATNIQYLAVMAEEINKRKGRPFHLIVDMRSWQIPTAKSFTQMKAAIKIDRRNQVSELWLEDDETNADHVAQKFFAETKFTLSRTKSVTDFIEQCAQKADDSVVQYVKIWLSNN
ncbi:arginine decarboxylase [Alteromonas sp. V450]|nr:arginine decarboxylase [Alteromonas sp. V450]